MINLVNLMRRLVVLRTAAPLLGALLEVACALAHTQDLTVQDLKASVEVFVRTSAKAINEDGVTIGTISDTFAERRRMLFAEIVEDIGGETELASRVPNYVESFTELAELGRVLSVTSKVGRLGERLLTSRVEASRAGMCRNLYLSYEKGRLVLDQFSVQFNCSDKAGPEEIESENVANRSGATAMACEASRAILEARQLESEVRPLAVLRAFHDGPAKRDSAFPNLGNRLDRASISAQCGRDTARVVVKGVDPDDSHGSIVCMDILLRKKQGAWVISQYLMQRKCR